MDMLTATLIGLGQIGMGFEFDEKRGKPASHLGALRRLKDKISLECIVDFDEEKLKKAEQFYGAIPVHLASADDFIHSSVDTDIIIVATPQAPHYGILCDTQKQKHPKLVFCEKPLTLRSSSADRIVSLYEEKGVSLCVNHTRRWEDSWVKAVGIAKSRTYGAVKFFHGEYSGDPWRVGVHMADLVNWFGAPDYNVERIEVPYLVFNAVIWMEEAAIAVGFNGATVSLMGADTSNRYSNVKELRNILYEKDFSREFGAETPILKAYENIVAHLEKGETLACTGEEGASAVKLVEEWMK